jgi:hypothetical protein
VKVFISRSHDAVWVQIRAEGPGLIGDLTEYLVPGRSLLGHPHEWWASLPNGEHEVPKAEAAAEGGGKC